MMVVLEGTKVTILVRVGKNMSAINITGKPHARVTTSTQGPVLYTNPILAFNRSHTLCKVVVGHNT